MRGVWLNCLAVVVQIGMFVDVDGKAVTICPTSLAGDFAAQSNVTPTPNSIQFHLVLISGFGSGFALPEIRSFHLRRSGLPVDDLGA